MTTRLAALLDEIRAAPAPIYDAASLVVELRAVLDAAAAEATAELDGDALPLRLPKDRLTRVLACEQLALATMAPSPLSEPVVRGRVLDRLLHHHVHGAGAAVTGPALAVAEGAFEAERDDELLAWLLDDPATRVRLAEDATDFAERLAALGPVDGVWWPRCEDRLRVDLAGGRAVCSARLDLVLGGHPTELPLVVVEAKSGPFTAEHRDGLFWYALLVALRHGRPPAAIVAWSAWDGAAWWQPVTADVLLGAVERGRRALHSLGELAAGRLAARTACRACGWCPERSSCPSAPVDDDDRGGDGVP